ncbi:hypothetical protein KAU88_05675 [Candidatus Bathyarchaeota archaeon]|nr:hypothetical protein [Candidatus Bathyarchaeota archaeon]
MVSIPKVTYNGFTSFHLAKWPIPSKRVATATIDLNRKLSFKNADFCIDAIINSYRYGRELQFVTLSRVPPVVEPRTDKQHTYYRMESGYLPLDYETANLLIELGYKIHSILDREKPLRIGAAKVVSAGSSLAELM